MCLKFMRGKSGRIVVELDPAIKRHLYSKLAYDGLTLKAWLVQKVDAYLADDDAVQLPLRQLVPGTSANHRKNSE